jgi:dCMP deaminase
MSETVINFGGENFYRIKMKTPPLDGWIKEINENTYRWDLHFLKEAKLISEMSKDPSTKCGACLVRHDRSIVSKGFNGFARKVKDSPERYSNRDLKYKIVLHAEENAILFSKEDLTGYQIFTWPFLSCPHCASQVIQKGISRITCPEMVKEDDPARFDRWEENFKLSREIYFEAGVEVVEYPKSLLADLYD